MIKILKLTLLFTAFVVVIVACSAPVASSVHSQLEDTGPKPPVVPPASTHEFTSIANLKDTLWKSVNGAPFICAKITFGGDGKLYYQGYLSNSSMETAEHMMQSSKLYPITANSNTQFSTRIFDGSHVYTLSSLDEGEVLLNGNQRVAMAKVLPPMNLASVANLKNTVWTGVGKNLPDGQMAYAMKFALQPDGTLRFHRGLEEVSDSGSTANAEVLAKSKMNNSPGYAINYPNATTVVVRISSTESYTLDFSSRSKATLDPEIRGQNPTNNPTLSVTKTGLTGG